MNRYFRFVTTMQRLRAALMSWEHLRKRTSLLTAERDQRQPTMPSPSSCRSAPQVATSPRAPRADLSAGLAARGFPFDPPVLPSAALFADTKFQDCLGLFRHTADFVVEASPALCLAACGDFGGTEAMPADGNSFEELLIAKHVRDCQVEGNATAVFRLRHPLPAALKQDTVISRSIMVAIQTFLTEARAKGVKAAAVVRNGPSAQGPDLFVLLVNGSEFTVQCIGAKHQVTGGEWSSKFAALGFPLPLRLTPVELARIAAGSSALHWFELF